MRRRKHRTNWGVYYSMRYPADRSEKWYIAFDKRTGQPLDAMSNIKKSSKCATKGVQKEDSPVLRMPDSGNHLFTTITPQKTNSIVNNLDSSKKSQEQSYTRKSKTYTRKFRHRNRTRKKSAEEVALDSLESILLDSSYFTMSFDSLLLNWDEDDAQRKTSYGDKIRHSNSRSSKRRKTYTRLQSTDDSGAWQLSDT